MVAIKVVVSTFPPVMITSFRIFTAGLVVCLILLFQKQFRKMTKREWLYTGLGGLFGMVGHQTLLALGLHHTTASNATLILALVPLTTSVFAMVFLHDRLTFFRLLGIVFGITGVVFIILAGSGAVSGIGIGSIFVFAAMFSQSSSFIFIDKATRTLNPKQATAVMLTLGSMLMFVISLFLNPSAVTHLDEGTLGVWAVFIGSAVIASGLGQMMYNVAIRNLGAGQTSIFMNLTPFFSLVGAAVFLGESISLQQMFGFVFIIAGVIFGTGYIDSRLSYRRKSSSPS